MKKLIFCLILLIVSIAAVSASDNFTDSDILEDGNKSSTDLKILIDEAPDASEINLEDDYTDYEGCVEITKALTINGNGHTIDAKNGGKIFNIASDNVVLKNITFINGFLRDGNGAVIYINANNTVIEDCYFKDNGIFSSTGSPYGGAIYCNGNLTIINSVFKNNNIMGIDIYSNGGAVYCDGDLTVTNSTFISNSVEGNGGAIYSTGTVNISNSTFTSNCISGQYIGGGAVSASAVNVNNSVFTKNNAKASVRWGDNNASARGGAIYAENANIHNCDFTANSVSIIDHIFSNGGGVYSYGITDIKGSTFTNNTADDGEALWAYYASTTMENNTFIDNEFTLVKAAVVIDAPDLVKYYGGKERFNVRLTDTGKAIGGVNITINLNGIDYIRTTDVNGVVPMTVNLNSGKYNATVKYGDLSVNSTITVKATVSGENITKIFRNATQYYATFYDSSGNTLANNTAVEFNINGVFYTRYTNENGTARMNINLNPGEYIITAKNPNSTEQYTNIITVLPTIVENNDLVKYYRNASQYSLRILDSQAKPVGEGVEVKFNINGVFYTRLSDENGYVNLNINLEPGKYIITAEYNGLMASNNITVLSVIETQNLSMKYTDGSQFNATILDGEGKPLAGANVTFNINGVFYDKVTDENGIAHLNINLMAGEYIITTTYNDLNAANKITITS